MWKRLFDSCAVSFALCSVLVAADSAPGTKNPPPKAEAKAPASTDVKLDDKGSLAGVLVDANGRPTPRMAVELRQGRTKVASATTNTKGEFQFPRLKPGTYQVVADKQSAAVRVWTRDTAPPKSLPKALLVRQSADGKVVRGQLAGIDLATGAVLATGAATVTVSGINLSETKDLQDDVNKTNQQVNAINEKVDDIQNSLANP